MDFLPPQKTEKLIDLGANYGYFSLWLQSIYPKVSLRSALVEPSTKCYASLERLVLDEQLEGRFRLFKSCIGNPSEEKAKFYERPHMASSMKKESRDEEGAVAPILKSSELHEYMPPPFDLLKCDIEGSEWQLLLHYQEILSETRHLILEWHSWHDGGGGRDQIISTLKSLNFSILKSSKTMPAAGEMVRLVLCLPPINPFAMNTTAEIPGGKNELAPLLYPFHRTYPRKLISKFRWWRNDRFRVTAFKNSIQR